MNNMIKVRHHNGADSNIFCDQVQDDKRFYHENNKFTHCESW